MSRGSSRAAAARLQAALRGVLDAVDALRSRDAEADSATDRIAPMLTELANAVSAAPDTARLQEALVERLAALLARDGPPADWARITCARALETCLGRVALRHQLRTPAVAHALAAALRCDMGAPGNSDVPRGPLGACLLLFSCLPDGADLLLAAPGDVPGLLLCLLMQATAHCAPRATTFDELKLCGSWLGTLANLAGTSPAVGRRAAGNPRALLAAAACVDQFVTFCEQDGANRDAASFWHAGLFSFVSNFPWTATQSVLGASSAAPVLAAALCRAWAHCAGRCQPFGLEVDFVAALLCGFEDRGCAHWLVTSPACAGAVRDALLSAVASGLRSCDETVRRSVCLAISYGDDVLSSGALGEGAGDHWLSALLHRPGLAAALVDALRWQGQSPAILSTLSILIAIAACLRHKVGLQADFAKLAASSLDALKALRRVAELFAGGQRARHAARGMPGFSIGDRDVPFETRQACAGVLGTIARMQPAAAAAAPGLLRTGCAMKRRAVRMRVRLFSAFGVDAGTLFLRSFGTWPLCSLPWTRARGPAARQLTRLRLCPTSHPRYALW